jgi:hypothetical protein
VCPSTYFIDAATGQPAATPVVGSAVTVDHLTSQLQQLAPEPEHVPEFGDAGEHVGDAVLDEARAIKQAELVRVRTTECVRLAVVGVVVRVLPPPLPPRLDFYDLLFAAHRY